VAPRRRTAFDDRGLLIEDGRHLAVYAGAMHYWRVEPAAWIACLRAMRDVGLRVVETYIPWRVHDAHGRYEFAGRHDLGRFLDEAHALGLAAFVRPGPHVNAELTGFGFPDRILADPAIASRTAAGTPAFMPAPPRAFPIPSYASEKLHAQVRTWYAAVAEVLRPRLAPEGPVVAIGVDNEAQMFFRLGAFDHDYHPDALAWWREHCAAIGLPESDPPRDATDPTTAAAWVRFKDVYLARALGAFAGMLDDVGLGEVARCHNLPPTEPFLYDLPRIAGAIGGPVGIDVYSSRADLGAARRRALHVVGSSDLPLVLECGVGFFPWVPPLDRDGDPDRARDQLLALLAAGIRGFNLFMAVERDRYYGAAIDRHGAVQERWIAPLVAALDEVDWPSLRRATPLALIASRADVRFGLASSVLEPMTPVVLEALGLGPAASAELGSDSGAAQHRRWFAAIERALALAAVPYAIVDESAPLARLAMYRAVIVPTIDRIDANLLATLHQLSIQIVIGPGTPTRDELDQPLATPLPRRLGRIRPGSLEDLTSLAEDLVGLAGDLPEHYAVERPAGVEASAYADGNGRVRVLFVHSLVGRAVTAVVTAEPGRALRDPFSAERHEIVDGRISVALAPLGVRMFVVE